MNENVPSSQIADPHLSGFQDLEASIKVLVTERRISSKYVSVSVLCSEQLNRATIC